MCIRHLGFVLLIWCPGELHAQSATQSCSAPSLDGGKFSPKRETYVNGTYVTYSCDLGRKPAVEGWWARSTCQNGTWSPQPQCIMEENCIPPKIPNAKYSESLTGWYEDGHKIRITCDEAYELKNRDATALCRNGSWSSVPVCERSVDACGAPPKVPHAVIVDHRHQELFAADTELQYECEDGYTAEGAGDDKTIVCIAGAWTEGPTCSRGTTPSTGHGGGSSGSSLQPAGGGSSSAPGTGQGGSTEGATGGSETQPAGRGTTPSTGHGGGSSGSSLQPAGGGSSTTSDSNGRDSRPPFIPTNNCGPNPIIPYAVVEVERNYLRYQCDDYHTLVGSDTVVCQSNRRWSRRPVCKEKPCVLNPAVYNFLKLSGFQRLNEGQQRRFPCIWDGYTSDVWCINGAITPYQCSSSAPGAGQGGSTEGATGGSETQPAGRGTTPSTGHGGGSSGSSLQPAGGGSSSAPGTGQGGSTEGATGGSETQPAGGVLGRGTKPTTGHGGGSSGSSLQPAGGGSSTTSDSNGGDSRPPFIPTNDCGPNPIIPYAVVEVERNYLRYRCDDYHTLVGLDTVVCQSNRWWSRRPVCKEKPCVLNPAVYNFLRLPGFQRLNEGQWRRFPCIWPGFTSDFECINGAITYYRCCDRHNGHCP